MNKSEILTKLVLIILPTLLSCCSTTKKNDNDKLKSQWQEKHDLIQVKADSTHYIYHLHSDTLYIGKKYPPDKSMMNPYESLSSRNAYREDYETNEIIRACVRAEDLNSFEENHIGFLIYLYIDSTGTVKEVEILMNKRFTNLVGEDYIHCVCEGLKGLKKTIPPAFKDYPYYKMGHGFFFK